MASMEDGLLLLCKFANDTLVLKFSFSKDFDQLLRAICENWSCLDPLKVRLFYSIPGHPNCFLRDDNELRVLFSLVNVLGLKFVDISVDVSCTEPVPSETLGTTEVCGQLLQLTDQNAVCVLADSEIDVHTVFDNELVNIGSQGSSSKERNLLTASWSKGVSHVGQCFRGGVKEFRSVLCKFSVEVGFKFKYMKNNKSKVIAVCSEKYESGCSWCICASVSKVNGFFYIKNFVSEHSCGMVLADCGVKRLNFNQISELIFDQFRVNPGLSSKEVVNLFRTNYGLEIPYIKAWRALEKAKGMIYGDANESFKLLRWYVSAALDNNPGSHITLDVENESNRFRRLFVSFHACIHGFRYCRPMLFMDGTFLKGRFKGVILSATGKDGNQGLYPLAFAVVDSETRDNWQWFLSELRNVVESHRTITFVSDRNAGLLEALPIVFPDANHFFCLQHLKRNLRDKFCGSTFTNSFREHLVWLFRECAHAPAQSIFEAKLNELRQCGGPIVDKFLEGLPFENWTNAYGKGCRYGEMSSNAAESFNVWLLDVRNLPITHMVDSIRIKLMNWFSERRKLSASWNGVLCPKMLDRLNDFVTEGRTWNVRKCSESIFEIFSTPSVTVDIQRRTCSCHMWELNGFPCVHAAVAIFRCSLSVPILVEQYFHVGFYQKLYEEYIHPIPSILLTECVSSNEPDIVAPPTKRQPGRPRKRRFRSRGEVVKRIKCGRCGKIGHHNRKTCKEAIP